MSKHKRERPESLGRTDTSSLLTSAERSRRKAWARHWFDGSARCPRCGHDDLHRLGVRSGGDTRVEEWQCANTPCVARWKVELRETAVALLTPSVPATWEWYERSARIPTFQILIQHGRVQGIRLAPGSPAPQDLPHFVVHDLDGGEAGHRADTDSDGTYQADALVPFLGDPH